MRVYTSITPEERFWPKVRKTDGCWLWAGALNNHGYGNFFISKGKWVSAHRFAYESVVGPIPEGLHLDHLCRNPPCVNPEHLEPVTRWENQRRGLKGPKDICHNGHSLLDPTNVKIRPNGTKWCRECSRQRARKYWALGNTYTQRQRRSET